MKLYTPEEVAEEPDEDFYRYDNNKGVFRPFYKTYKWITFSMVIAMVYPNARLNPWRIKCLILLCLSFAPLAMMMLTDIYFFWIKRDIVNIIRHSTILGPFLGGIFKIILLDMKRQQAADLIKEFHRDYFLFNKFSREYQDIARDGVRNSVRYTEAGWLIMVAICVIIFPTMAIGLNLYEFMTKYDATKHMIHDLNRPFAEPEARLESPFYEILFVYELYFAFVYMSMFIGYDSFFGLSINHACIKIQLYCKALENIFHTMEDPREMVVEVIREQCRMYRFVDLIQDTFNNWLGIIFVATMVQICTCLYHITEGYGFDLRYTIFVTGAVTHIYLPCRYAAKMKAESQESALLIYCSGWERVHDDKVRRMIAFMIARAQQPAAIIAFNMITFDMELFVSILQTSYSMYTLLRS